MKNHIVRNKGGRKVTFIVYGNRRAGFYFKKQWQEIGVSKYMAMILKDILVDIEHADFTFENPLKIKDESGHEIGYAELLKRSDQLYATLYLEGEENYTDSYPKAEINTESRDIVSLVISSNKNNDIRIEKISDQEIIHASSGAENAGLK